VKMVRLIEQQSLMTCPCNAEVKIVLENTVVSDTLELHSKVPGSAVVYAYSKGKTSHKIGVA
jgi:hypothetical protein